MKGEAKAETIFASPAAPRLDTVRSNTVTYLLPPFSPRPSLLSHTLRRMCAMRRRQFSRDRGWNRRFRLWRGLPRLMIMMILFGAIIVALFDIQRHVETSWPTEVNMLDTLMWLRYCWYESMINNQFGCQSKQRILCLIITGCWKFSFGLISRILYTLFYSLFALVLRRLITVSLFTDSPLQHSVNVK